LKPRKTKTGWNIVEPIAPEAVTEEVVSQAAPAAGMPLDFHTLVEAHEKAFGNKARWHMVSEGHEITADERTRLLETVLGDLSMNVENVRALVISLKKSNSQGWSLSMSFGVLTQIAEEWLAERGASIKEEKANGGFQRGLVDPQAAIDRVAAVYRAMPRGADDPKLLELALGDNTLDETTVMLLWLSFAYWYKEVLNAAGAGSDIMPQPARWIMACCCSFINTRHIAVPAPSGLSSAEYVAFRS